MQYYVYCPSFITLALKLSTYFIVYLHKWSPLALTRAISLARVFDAIWLIRPSVRPPVRPPVRLSVHMLPPSIYS